MIAPTYIHPSSGAEVVDVVCPKGHKGGSGHVASGQLGTATCGHILRSHKEPGAEETVDGKKVKATVTVVDAECKEILVPAFDPKGKKAERAKAQARGEEADAAARASGKGAGKGKKGGKAAKAAKRNPDAV